MSIFLTTEPKARSIVMRAAFSALQPIYKDRKKEVFATHFRTGDIYEHKHLFILISD